MLTRRPIDHHRAVRKDLYDRVSFQRGLPVGQPKILHLHGIQRASDRTVQTLGCWVAGRDASVKLPEGAATLAKVAPQFPQGLVERPEEGSVRTHLDSTCGVEEWDLQEWTQGGKRPECLTSDLDIRLQTVLVRSRCFSV